MAQFVLNPGTGKFEWQGGGMFAAGDRGEPMPASAADKALKEWDTASKKWNKDIIEHKNVPFNDVPWKARYDTAVDADKRTATANAAAVKAKADLVQSDRTFQTSREDVLYNRGLAADALALKTAEDARKRAGVGNTSALRAAQQLETARRGRQGVAAGATYLEGAADKNFLSTSDRIKGLFDGLTGDATTAAAGETDRIGKLFNHLEGTTNALSDGEKVRIRDLYDGLDVSAKAQFDDSISQLGLDVDAGTNTIATASKSFADNFQGSKSYQGVPTSQMDVGANPLLAALQSQGAGTEAVAGATDAANQSMKSTADLQKWMLEQLNTGSQNFDSSVRNAASQAQASSIADLAARKVSITGGMTRDYTAARNANAASRSAEESANARALQDRLTSIAMQRGSQESANATNLAAALAAIKTGTFDATSSANKSLQDQLDEAAAMRARSLATYGVGPKPVVPVRKKPVVSAGVPWMGME